MAVVLGLAGCDSGPSEAEKAAAAAKAAEEAEQAERLAERKREREAKEKAEAEAEAEHRRKIDALASLPEKMPKKLAPACKGVGEAQDAFMKRLFADRPDTVEKWKMAAGSQIPMIVTACKKSGSIEVAACQKNALDHATEEFRKEFSALLQACVEKFGPKDGANLVPPA